MTNWNPTGMAGTVNVSDLLTQWKVPNLARKNARVLADARGQILWVFAWQVRLAPNLEYPEMCNLLKDQKNSSWRPQLTA